MAQLNTQPIGVSRPALTLLKPSPAIPVRAHGQDAALEQLTDLSGLVAAAGGRLAIRQGQRDAMAVQAGTPDGCWLRLHSEMTPLAAGANPDSSDVFSCYPVRGLRGILAARNPNLSLSIVGISRDWSAEALRAAVAFAAPGVSRPAVGMEASLGPGERPGNHDFNLQPVDAGLCAAQLSQGEVPLGLDVLVVPRAQADQLAMQAAAASGTRGLRVMATVDRCGMSVSVLPCSFVNQPQLDPSGAILAAVTLLLGTGQREAAQRLHNGWLATLEAGFHTAAFKHIAPYTRQLTGDEFFTAVKAHLGERPERLTSARYLSSQPSGSVQPPALRLVR